MADTTSVTMAEHFQMYNETWVPIDTLSLSPPTPIKVVPKKPVNLKAIITRHLNAAKKELKEGINITEILRNHISEIKKTQIELSPENQALCEFVRRNNLNLNILGLFEISLEDIRLIRMKISQITTRARVSLFPRQYIVLLDEYNTHNYSTNVPLCVYKDVRKATCSDGFIGNLIPNNIISLRAATNEEIAMFIAERHLNQMITKKYNEREEVTYHDFLEILVKSMEPKEEK